MATAAGSCPYRAVQVTLLIADPIFTTLGTISRVFHGKGTPDEIRDVLRLASLWISAEEASSQQRLLTRDISSFARQFIGVDCNGFVGTYLRENHPGTHFGAQFYIPGDNPFR